MNLTLSDEQRLFSDALARMLRDSHSFERRRELVAKGAWGLPEAWAALVDLGCFMLPVSEARGGLAAGAVEMGLLANAVGRHLVMEPVIETLLVAKLLSESDPAAGDMLNRVVAGDARLGLVFGDRGAPLRSVRGGWQGHGLLIADEDGLFLAESAHMQVRPVPMLDDVMAYDVDVAPACLRQIAGGEGWPDLRAGAMALQDILLLNETCGIISAALDATIDHVRERHQFGKPISAFQTVQHRISEMLVAAREAEAIVTLATLTYDAAGPGQKHDRARAGAIARTTAAAELVADTGVQLHGGMGVSDESRIAAYFRKLQAFRFRAGDMRSAAVEMVKNRAHRQSAVLIEG